jgi:Sulfotransferase domain
VLPTYVIAGTVRSGTTSLHRLLRQHPEVFAAETKELHFFDRNFERGVEWYEQLFAEARPGQAVGEATPNYVYHPLAVARMAQVIPHAKVIVLLRDPVERAYSQYWMQRTARHETLAFPAALDAEARRLASGDELDRAYYSYVDRGRYLPQLLRLREHYPAEQTLVVLQEDLHERADQTYREVCAFVGVGTDHAAGGLDERANRHRSYRSDRLRDLTHALRRRGRVGRLVAHGVAKANSRATAYPPMDARTRARLAEAFAEPNAELAVWLGRDLSHWTAPTPGPGPGPGTPG